MGQDPSGFLQQHFPDIQVEIDKLQDPRLQGLTGYVNYRHYILLHTICSTLGVPLNTRKLTKGYNFNGFDITLSDIYQWLRINEGTFSNKRTELQKTYNVLKRLGNTIADGLADSDLLYASQLWYPFRLSCSQLLTVDEQRWPASVRWKIKDLVNQTNYLCQCLSIVPHIS